MRLEPAQLQSILTAYHNGVAQGEVDSTLPNPYEKFTTEWDAWRKGYLAGIARLDARAGKPARVTLPEGWGLTVHQDADRVWLNVSDPDGRVASISAVAKISNGRATTICAGVLLTLGELLK